MRLAEAREGTVVSVKRILGGGECAKRLLELGLFPGAVVEIFMNDGGPVVVRIGESRQIVGRGAAEKIEIETG